MTNKLKAFIVLLSLIALIDCVRTRGIRYETLYREPKPANFPIEIYESSDITRPYKVIGIIQANAGKLHSTKDTIRKLKAEARKMGGDALIDLSFGASKGRMITKTQTGYVSGSAREIWTAKVIVWIEEKE